MMPPCLPRDFLAGLSDIPDLQKRPLHYVFEDLKLQCLENDLWLEFGVYCGDTINYFSRFTDETVYGFDSFEGLPETWRRGFKKGVFDRKGELPEVNKNVILVKGWFVRTLEDFISKQEEKEVAFIHVDCDLYHSAKYVLDALTNHIKPGCVIVFDELVNYAGYAGENGELRAWYEIVTENEIQYEWIGMNGKIETVECPVQSVALRYLG